jgi:hypothetical protein
MTRLLIPSVAALAILLPSCGSSKRHYPNVIVLGVDGMDPSFVERHWDALPNLAALRDKGTFVRLATTTPPQSPVAWSTFITGLDPPDHEIFDFVHRDPETMQPFSSMSRTEPPKWALPIGPYRFPLTASRVVSLRRGIPFWQRIADGGVPVSIIHMPTNYPPVQVGNALAGMGTPDLLGSQGTFTFVTDDPVETSRSVAGGRFIKITFDQGHALFSLDGPGNTLRKDGRPVSANVVIDVDPDNPVARVKTGDQVIILQEGEWSDWIPVEFPLIPHLASIQGMVRLFAKQLHPGFELYISPINLDPAKPSLPISAPPNWSQTLARATGPFSTLGIPEDTSALRQNALTLPQFQEQTHHVFQEEQRLLRYSLRHYNGGLLFFYFSSVDQGSHILWLRYDAELLKIYHDVDGLIGEARQAFPGAEMIVMSDHGFTTFDRAVHLNAWLRDHGYLKISGPLNDDAGMASIDWSATKAYALGLNGLFATTGFARESSPGAPGMAGSRQWPTGHRSCRPDPRDRPERTGGAGPHRGL